MAKGDCGARDLRSLDSSQLAREFVPVVHDLGDAQSLEDTGNLFLLLLAMVWSGVANDRDAGADSRGGTALAILNGDTFAGLLAENLAGVQVDGGIGLARGLLERSGGAEDVVGREVLGLVDLLDRGLDTTKGARGDYSEAIFLGVVELLQLLGGVNTRLGGFLELGNHAVLLHLDVGLEVFGGDGKVVDLLQGAQHTAEVLTDEVGDELLAGVVDVLDPILGEDLVRKVGAGLEGELLGQDERVVAVEQDVSDLDKC